MNTNEKYIQNQKTLRLMVLFNKIATMEDIIFMYNVLQTKDRMKGVYIIEAMNYYLKNKDKINIETAKAEHTLRLINHVKGYYSIETKEDIKKVLSDKKIYSQARKLMLPNDEPSIVTLGFRKTDPEHQRMHDILFKMKVNTRIMTMCEAIKLYIYTNNDPGMVNQLMYTFVVNLADKYVNHKEEVINELAFYMEVE